MPKTAGRLGPAQLLRRNTWRCRRLPPSCRRAAVLGCNGHLIRRITLREALRDTYNLVRRVVRLDLKEYTPSGRITFKPIDADSIKVRRGSVYIGRLTAPDCSPNRVSLAITRIRILRRGSVNECHTWRGVKGLTDEDPTTFDNVNV